MWQGMMSCVGASTSTWWSNLPSPSNPNPRVHIPCAGSNCSAPEFVQAEGGYVDNNLSPSTIYRTLYRPNFLQDAGKVTVRLGRMPYMSSDPRYGFLGKKNTQTNEVVIPEVGAKYSDFNFKKCSSIKQCYAQEFTVYGHFIQSRLVKSPTDVLAPAVERQPIDTFECGSFGRKLNQTTCQMDLAVVPLFRILCHSSSSRDGIVQGCRSSGRDSLFPTSSTIKTQYCDPLFTSPLQGGIIIPQWNTNLQEASLQVIAGRINRLTDIFSSGESVQQQKSRGGSSAGALAYMQAMQCANTIFAKMQTSTLGVPTYTVQDGNLKLYAGTSMYRFSKFALYEYPLSWFVRCTMLLGKLPGIPICKLHFLSHVLFWVQTALSFHVLFWVQFALSFPCSILGISRRALSFPCSICKIPMLYFGHFKKGTFFPMFYFGCKLHFLSMFYFGCSLHFLSHALFWAFQEGHFLSHALSAKFPCSILGISRRALSFPFGLLNSL